MVSSGTAGPPTEGCWCRRAPTVSCGAPQGTVEAHLFFAYGGKAPSAPTIPAKLPGRGLPASRDYYFTTSGTGPGAVNYRALAKPLADGSGVIVVAVPLGDLESTLRHLLWIELIVSAVVLVGLGVLSWVMVRRDLRPLESMTRTAGAIAQGDLSQRVSPVVGRHRGGPAGRGLQHHDRRDRAGLRPAGGVRGPAPALPGRRLPRAAHAVDLDPRVRRALRPRDAGPARPTWPCPSGTSGTRPAAWPPWSTTCSCWPSWTTSDRCGVEPVDLVELARRAAAGRLGRPPPTGRWWSRGTGPVVVDGDPDRLRQVVDNLVGNAVRHTPAGDRRRDPGGGRRRTVGHGDPVGAVITVHDDGPGIDPVDAPRVFEPFYRSDPSRSRSSGGAGLGLAIVAAIVAAHGGTVALLPGPGATFEVRLPVEPGPTGSGTRWRRSRPSPAVRPARRRASADGSGRDVPDRRLGDLAGPDARGADVEALGRAVHERPGPAGCWGPSAAWSAGGSG